jgi:tRNA(Ile)-lysidine synthetase-like protein
MGNIILAPAVLREVESRPECVLCVACSGGSDSVALVHLLLEQLTLRERVVILHYEHGVRPIASCQDREFVQGMAEQLHVPFFAESRPVQPGSPPNEEVLRNFRLDFFRRTMATLQTPYLFTAHHRDDALETLLLRLARGGNLDALTAPHEIHHFPGGAVHLRPLLSQSKADLIRYLREHSIPWCEDGTNAENMHTRNCIRNQLLPLWRSFEPRRNLANSLWRSRQLLLEDCEALEALAKSVYQSARQGNALHMTVLLEAPTAIRRRVIHRHLMAHGCSACATTMAMILDAINSQKKHQIMLSNTCCLRVGDGILYLANFPA